MTGMQQIVPQLRELLMEVLNWLQQWLVVNQHLAAFWMLIFFSMMTGALLYRGFSVIWRRWRIARRFKRGLIAEKHAARYLRRHGYRILAAQLQEPITVYVNGEAQDSTVRADFLVRKGWKTYIVEVKSGQQGTVRQAATRRQLLEYKLVYEPDGIILLDMEHHNLQKINFAYSARRRSEWLRYGIISLISGALVYGLLQIF